MLLTFEGIENFRDMGGLVRGDGASLRGGLLLRCGHLGRATDGDLDQLESMGVCAVIDLRDVSEREREPDRAVAGAENRHLPAVADLGTLFGIPISQITAAQAHEEFQTLYRYLAQSEESKNAYAEFFACLLRAAGRPVVFHCTQGKDRTGVGAALLLTALGFDRAAVVEEYMLTNQAMERRMDALRAKNPAPEELALAREVLLVFRENMTLYFQCLEESYGSARAYLEKAIGLGPAEIKALEKYYMQLS
ncbi:MAG: tyrosine-protein phosphatase [Oscillospiraceae bacterium]|nr:tyrosine-protein phosphatase [Oscillospiraceae bacterium]